ncbi:MAG: hypothetical protein ACI84C_001322 [Flavobacteriales bacterium]|jgi:hypothetical protein
MDWIGKLNRTLAVIVFGIAKFALVAQEALPFPEDNWDKATEGLDYGPVNDPEVRTPKKGGDFSFSEGDWLLYLIAAILIALIIFLTVKVMDKKQASGKSKIGSARDYSHDQLEENLKELDLDDYLRKALSDEDYRAAVRLNYLMVIQLLDQLSLIKWQRDKTNRDYLRELSAHPKNQQFQRLTSNYEYIWYGDLILSLQDFRSIEPPFHEFMDALNSPDEQ